MRIISQDGKIDVPYEMTAFHLVGGIIKMNMVGETGKGTVMASYLWEEKALKAMEMLHEVYMIHENYKKLDAEIQISISKEVAAEKIMMYGGVFGFPQEDEL